MHGVLLPALSSSATLQPVPRKHLPSDSAPSGAGSTPCPGGSLCFQQKPKQKRLLCWRHAPEAVGQLVEAPALGPALLILAGPAALGAARCSRPPWALQSWQSTKPPPAAQSPRGTSATCGPCLSHQG